MSSFRRASFLVALGLACCLVFGVQSHPMTLDDRAVSPIALEGRSSTSPLTLERRETSPMTLERRRTITMRIKGHDYTLKSISSYEQGQNSVTYRVVGGFEGVAAIVKIIDSPSKAVSDNAKKETKVLRKAAVNQLLHYEKEKKSSGVYKWILVLQDIHENYPQPGDQLAPLHEILNENPDIDPATAVRHVRDLALRQVTALADHGNFVYVVFLNPGSDSFHSFFCMFDDSETDTATFNPSTFSPTGSSPQPTLSTTVSRVSSTSAVVSSRAADRRRLGGQTLLRKREKMRRPTTRLVM
ncbi:hypothetical protein CPB85DRAFT_216192 [Mucidula mucida]|nr:hypothetical protein CPB85DRAFT_216192 [Mucidula mucida]